MCLCVLGFVFLFTFDRTVNPVSCSEGCNFYYFSYFIFCFSLLFFVCVITGAREWSEKRKKLLIFLLQKHTMTIYSWIHSHGHYKFWYCFFFLFICLKEINRNITFVWTPIFWPFRFSCESSKTITNGQLKQQKKKNRKNLQQ